MQKCARKFKAQGGKIQAAPAPTQIYQTPGKVSDFAESLANMEKDSPVLKEGDSDHEEMQDIRQTIEPKIIHIPKDEELQ